MKRQPTEWKKIFANHISYKGLMPQIYKLLIQLNCKKQTIWSKNGQRTWSDIFPNKRTMANRYMKNLSILLIIRKMQIKTTMRYYLTPVRIVMIKKMRDNKCWQGCREKRTVMHHNGECKLVHPLQKTVWWFLKKLKRKLPYYPAIPLLGLYLEKKKKNENMSTPPCSLQHCLQQPRHGNNQSISWWMNG